MNVSIIMKKRWKSKNCLYGTIFTTALQRMFNTSNHELDRPLPNAKNKKVIGLIKDE